MAIASPLVVIRTTCNPLAYFHFTNFLGEQNLIGTYLLVNLNVLLVAKQTGKHELGTIADGVDGRILNYNSLVGAEESLKGLDDGTEVGLATAVIVLPLSVENVVEGHHVAVVLRHDTGADTTQLLHVGADSEKETQVHAEGSDIGTGLAGHPEDTEVTVIVELDELALVDSTDTELTLDGRDKGRSLEESTGKGLEGLSEGGLATGDLVVEPDDGDVLLTSTLLGLDESRSTVNADNCSFAILVSALLMAWQPLCIHRSDAKRWQRPWTGGVSTYSSSR